MSTPTVLDWIETGEPGVQSSSLEIASKTGILRGTLTRHASKTVARAVLLLHGWGGDRVGPHRILVRLSRALAGKGVMTLRIDLAGRGCSDGDAASVTLDEMIQNALDGRAWLLEQAGIKSVALGGLCSGGNIAIGAATRAPVDRLALLSLPLFQERSGTESRGRFWHFLGIYARKALSLSTWKRLFQGEIQAKGVARTLQNARQESDRHLKDSSRDLPAAFATTRQPCLFVFGGNDPEAGPSRDYFAPLCKQAGIPHEIVTVPEANHNYYTAHWSAQAEAAAVAFLTDGLAGVTPTQS